MTNPPGAMPPLPEPITHGVFGPLFNRHQMRDFALAALASKPVAPPAVPSTCDGKEQDAFEAWASGERFDMALHPLHWLFLNEKTYAARQGWKGALRYVGAVLSATTPAPAGQSDSELLDWLDATNKRFQMGWYAGVAPVGNVSLKTIIMGGLPIREAISAAQVKAGGEDHG